MPMFGYQKDHRRSHFSAGRRPSSALDDNSFDDRAYQSSSTQRNSFDLVQSEALQLLDKRKRRKRVRYSCTECHRRKHKCDRETPCGKCVERGVASSCAPSGGDDSDVHERMRQLENALARLVQATRSNSDPIDPQQNQPESAPPTYSAHNANNATTSGSLSPAPRPVSSYPTSNARQTRSSTPRRKSNPAITTAASLPFRAQVGSEILEFSSSTQSYPPSAHYERLVREGNLHQDEIRTLASGLPSQDETATLLDVFFRDINPLMFPFDELWFREALNSAVDVIWGDQDVMYGQDGPDHLSLITLLYAVLALTSLSLPLWLGTEAHGAAQAARWSFQCRKCHMLATSIQCHDLFIVLSYILSARFLVLQRQAKDSWLTLGSAIREAQILGLHRLGPTPQMGTDESRTTVMRRTIWMHLYFEDCFLSLIVGQAPSIHDTFCDTAPPARLPSPSTDADAIHFDLGLILHIRMDMCRIVSRILDLFFSDEHDMTYDAVLRLDRELQDFQDCLPLPYRMDDARTGYVFAKFRTGADDGVFRRVALQRFLLHVSISYLLVSLHLPYLRRGSADSGFERSRQAAIDAAICDHSARQELRQHVDWPDHLARDGFVGGRFFYFHATSALGICLLSEPDSKQVRRLAPLLDEFLKVAKHHQRQQGVDPNRCIRQEIGIVSLIRGRVRRRLDSGTSTSSLHLENPTSPISLQNSSSAQTRDSLKRHPRRTAADPTSPRAVPNVADQVPLDMALPAPRSELMDTRQPEIGEDMYDWWSWLVSNLTPSDMAFDTALTGTAPVQHTPTE